MSFPSRRQYTAMSERRLNSMFTPLFVVAGTAVRNGFDSSCEFHPLERFDLLKGLPIDGLVDFDNHICHLLIPGDIHVGDVRSFFRNRPANVLNASGNVLGNNHDRVRVGAEIHMKSLDLLYLDSATPQRSPCNLNGPSALAPQVNPGSVGMELVDSPTDLKLPFKPLLMCNFE